MDAARGGMSLSVVTPWWNHLELLHAFATCMNYGQPDEVIVIDNGSTPDFEPVGIEPLTVVIRNPTNRGFCRACNQGLWVATGDAVLFLNNDIRPISKARWADTVKAALEPGVLVGARLRNDAHTQVDGQSVPYLDGWCIAGMRDDLLKLGGWNETYAEPAYYSDNDLSVRAVAAGMTLKAIDLPIAHIENASIANMDLSAVVPANHARYCALVRGLQ